VNLLNKYDIQKIRQRLEANNKIIFLIIPVCLIIIYLDFNFLINRQLSSIKAAGPKIIKVKKDLAGLEQDLTRIQDIKNKQDELKQNIISKAKKIITDEQKVSVLQDISDLANKGNVKVSQIKFSYDSAGQKTANDSSAAKLAPLLINLDLICGYHQLGAFLNDLENMLTFIAVHNIKITPQATDLFRQKVDLVLRTYVRK
jgi:Tfp pilus assembly protein PilO